MCLGIQSASRRVTIASTLETQDPYIFVVAAMSFFAFIISPTASEVSLLDTTVAYPDKDMSCARAIITGCPCHASGMAQGSADDISRGIRESIVADCVPYARLADLQTALEVTIRAIFPYKFQH